MNRFWLAILAFTAMLFGNPANAAFDPYAGPKPIAVVIERNPWLMVVGSDTPRLTVYDNGDVVFLRKAGDEYALRIAHLTPFELSKLEEAWSPLFGVQMRNQYNLSDWTDQSTTQMFFQRGTRQVSVSAYGLACSGAAPPSESKDAKLPTELATVHRALCDLDFADSEPWSPVYIEVMLWDYSYAPDKSIQWPAEWPNLTSERAKRRGDMWSIYLDHSELLKLDAFLRTQNEKGAVEVGGKKWAASYRFVFPSEPVWSRALRPAADKE